MTLFRTCDLITVAGERNGGLSAPQNRRLHKRAIPVLQGMFNNRRSELKGRNHAITAQFKLCHVAGSDWGRIGIMRVLCRIMDNRLHVSRIQHSYRTAAEMLPAILQRSIRTMRARKQYKERCIPKDCPQNNVRTVCRHRTTYDCLKDPPEAKCRTMEGCCAKSRDFKWRECRPKHESAVLRH